MEHKKLTLFELISYRDGSFEAPQFVGYKRSESFEENYEQLNAAVAQFIADKLFDGDAEKVKQTGVFEEVSDAFLQTCYAEIDGIRFGIQGKGAGYEITCSAKNFVGSATMITIGTTNEDENVKDGVYSEKLYIHATLESDSIETAYSRTKEGLKESFFEWGRNNTAAAKDALEAEVSYYENQKQLNENFVVREPSTTVPSPEYIIDCYENGSTAKWSTVFGKYGLEECAAAVIEVGLSCNLSDVE